VELKKLPPSYVGWLVANNEKVSFVILQQFNDMSMNVCVNHLGHFV